MNKLFIIYILLCACVYSKQGGKPERLDISVGDLGRLSLTEFDSKWEFDDVSFFIKNEKLFIQDYNHGKIRNSEIGINNVKFSLFAENDVKDFFDDKGNRVSIIGVFISNKNKMGLVVMTLFYK